MHLVVVKIVIEKNIVLKQVFIKKNYYFCHLELSDKLNLKRDEKECFFGNASFDLFECM